MIQGRHFEAMRSREYKFESKLTRLNDRLDMGDKGQGRTRSNLWVLLKQ